MAVQTITYGDKSYLNQNADIPATNKVQDIDMNEIKSVVNNNANEFNSFKQELIPTVLYENQSGSTSNITLNDNISNYTFYEITFSRGGKGYNTVRMSTNFLTNVCLMTSFYGGNLYRIYMTNISISGTTLTINYGRYLNVADNATLSTGEESSVLIYKVIGYK